MNADDRDFISSTMAAKTILVFIAILDCALFLLILASFISIYLNYHFVALMCELMGIFFIGVMFIFMRAHDRIVEKRKDRAIFGGMKYLW